MKNLEWLRTLDADAFAKLVAGVCPVCAYNDGRCPTGDVTCNDGIREWLELEHEELDTWEKIEDDTSKTACQYFGKTDVRCIECEHCGSCKTEQMTDLVRRCKELAEGKN